MFKSGDVINYRFDDGTVKVIVTYFDLEDDIIEFFHQESDNITSCYSEDIKEGRIENLDFNVWNNVHVNL